MRCGTATGAISAVKAHKLEPLARIVGYANAAQAPEWFTTAPAKAIDAVNKKLGFKNDQIDLYEINEAFAVVALAVSQLCDLDPQKVNVRGGAVALGHPIGSSGARSGRRPRASSRTRSSPCRSPRRRATR